MKLQELADLLMELQCAKEDGYLAALSYMDTACGINPVVAKLPYALKKMDFCWFEVQRRK